MKRILIILFVFLSLKVFSQPPVTNSVGSTSTAYLIKGVPVSDSGYWYRYSFPDTGSANHGQLWKTPGLEIRVGDTLFYIRNQAASAWILTTKAGGSGGSGVSGNLGAGYRYYVPASTGIKTSFAGLYVLIDSSSNSNGLTFKVDSATMFPAIRSSLPVANSFVYRDSASAINIVSLGAVGDGTTDNAAIFKTARNLAKTYGYAIFIPAGTFYTSDSVLLNKCRIFGNGINSVIKVLSTTTSLYVKDTTEVAGLKLVGTGQSTIPGGILTDQNGIRVIGSGNDIHDNTFVSLGGAGIAIYETVGTTIFRNMTHGNYYIDCTIGNDMPVNAEENVVTGDVAYSCTVGFRNRNSGNNNYVNIQATYCDYNFTGETTGGANGDHCTISGFRFNHAVVLNIDIKSSTYGYDFKNGQLWAGNITFGSSDQARNTTISESMIGGAVTITATSTYGNSCSIRDNMFSDLTLTKAGSDTLEYVNNKNAATTDAFYLQDLGNIVGQNGKWVGSRDNFDFSIKTNNTARLNILSTGEVGIGTAAAAGFKVFIASAGNTDATYLSLMRNGDGLNLYSQQNGGTFSIGNPSVSSNTGSLYGQIKLMNTNLGSGTDSVLTIDASNNIKALPMSAIVGAVPTWEATIIKQGATAFTQANTVDFGANDFTLDNMGSYLINRSGNQRFAISSTNTYMRSANGTYQVSADNSGIILSTLTNASSQDRLIGQTSGTSVVNYLTVASPLNITSGVLGVTASAVTMPINNLLAATGANDINNGDNQQIWRANTLGVGHNLLSLRTSGWTGSGGGLTGGLLSLVNTSNALATGASFSSSIIVSGTNSNSSVQSVGQLIQVNNTGTTSTNTGLYLDASGATTNNAIMIAAGNVATSLSTINLFPATATTINIGGANAAVVSFSGGTSSGKIRLLEPSGSGTNYSEFQTVAQASNITYSLPATNGSGNLFNNGSGVLAWVPAGDYWNTGGTTTLASNPVTIEMGDKTLTFHGSDPAAAFVVDGANLGINVLVPTVALDVLGGINFNGVGGNYQISADNAGNIDINASGAARITFDPANGFLTLSASTKHFINGAPVQMDNYTAGVATFDVSGNISSIAPSTSGNLLTSNGSAWVSSAPAAASVTWNGISNPTGTQSLTFDDAELNAWTMNSNTETFQTITANSLTTGIIESLASSSLTTGTFVNLSNTSTTLAAGNELLNIAMSGANGTNAITATGARISVTNTNATSGTNIGLSVTASGATTDNWAVDATGNLRITSANTTQATTSSSLYLTAGTTSGTMMYLPSTTITSGNAVQLVSTSTTLAAGNEMLDISMSGANGTNAITATGARISVTNTNATSGTNIGLDVTATGATTKNVGLSATGGAGSSTSFAAQFTGRIATGGCTAPFADIDNANGSIATGSIIVTTSAGTNQTGNFSTGSQGLVGSNVGSIYQFLSSSTVNAHVYVGGTGATAVGVGLPGATMITGSATLAEAASGNHPLLAGLVVLAPTITGAAATVSDAATVYIGGPTNATVSGGNYSLLIASGNAQLTNGNLTLGTAGNKLFITTGTNASMGTATLTGGTVTVSTTAVTANSKIFLTDATTGALTNVGSPTVGTIVAGTSFVINSTNVLDASAVNWLIVN